MRMVVWLQVKVRGRGLSVLPIGCTPALCVTHKALLQLQLALFKWYMFLHYVSCRVSE